jgi:hypothetical protein
MVSIHLKTSREGSLNTWRHTTDDAPTHEAHSAQPWGNSEQYFSLGLTCALIDSNHREQGFYIWSTLAKPKLKRHYLWLLKALRLKTEGSTPTSSFKAQHQELKTPSSYTKEATTPSQQKLPEKPRPFKTSIARWKPSDLFVHTR